MPPNPLSRGALTLVALCLGVSLSAAASTAQGQESQSDALRIFFDCSGRDCNSTYYRTEIPWVNWVRDRTLAQVHLIMTSEQNASGGREYSFDFLGQEELEGEDDLLTYMSLGTDTGEENLRGISQVLAIGLARYSVLVGAGEGLQVQRTGGARELTDRLVTGDQVNDPWNFWVFNIGVNGNYEEESSENERRFRGNFSASRTTTTWRVRLRGSGSYNRGELALTDSTVAIDQRTNWNVNQEVVYALADHWSTAFTAGASASTRSNQDFGVSVRQGIEFSVWPYEEAPRRSLTAVYRVGIQYFDWDKTTEFGRNEETRPEHRLQLQLFQRQPWGDSRVSLRASSFLDDFSQNSVEFNGNLSVRLFRGLRLNLGGGLERIRDQIFLPAGGLTEEEILLRQRERASDYQFDIRMGLSYQFGSIFNNVVNNRF